MENDMYPNEPRPRLCHLKRWPNFNGYGFNLHCDKKKVGQYIGKVDANSPAESAGLRENDRIIEVNHVPVGNENHKQVVSRIKEGVTRNNTKYPDEVMLLVVDPETDAYFNSKSIVVRSDDPNVLRIETRIQHDLDSIEHSPPSSTRSLSKAESPISNRLHQTNGNYKHITDFTGPTVTQIKTDSPSSSRHSYRETDRHDISEIAIIRPSSPPSDDEQHQQNSNNSKAFNTSTTASSDASPPSQSSGTALQLAMSAAEYREKIKAQSARKRDLRQEKTMSMKQKHALIDQL